MTTARDVKEILLRHCDTDRNSAAESSDEEKIYVLPRERPILTVGVEQFWCPVRRSLS